MTTEQEAPNLSSASISSTKSVADDFEGLNNLRNRLLSVVLPSVLVPLIIASGVGYVITENRAKAKVIEKLESDTLLGGKTFATFIRDSFNIANVVVANPEVTQAMQAGSKEAEEQQLAQKPIADVEKNFADTKLLITDVRLNNFLDKIAESTQITDILITERNGFNVAFRGQFDNFVHSDKEWWQETKEEGRELIEPDELEEQELAVSDESEESDESEGENFMAFSQVVQDPLSDEFWGIIMVKIPLARLNSDLTAYLYAKSSQPSQFQIFESDSLEILTNIDNIEKSNEPQTINLEDIEVSGRESIIQVAQVLVETAENSLSLEEAQKSIAQLGFSDVRLRQEDIFSETNIIASLRYQDKIYSIATIPGTDFVSSSVVSYDLVADAGRNLLLVFVLTSITLGAIALRFVFAFTQRLSKPLIELSGKNQQVRELLQQQTVLLEQQTVLTNKQRQEKEQLETAIYTLIDEISDATEGDLTVRANLESVELSTVADLFNAIISSLQEIAIEARQSTTQVETSLKQNENIIRLLAKQAITEAQETRKTLTSVQQMSQSIQEVARNANQAEQIVDDTYKTVLNSTENMDLTVESILNLRTTVGDTAHKMNRLGASSQKIAQALSFIEEIALKTNVLAINARNEAHRAGEYGQGFAAVAEQVGILAEQCSTATQEISRIVTTIQAETQEVSQAMKLGTTQVAETTRLVESTKESLSLMLEKSQAINQLMGLIAQSTISQTTTSQNVTNLMQKIAQLSEVTSKSSQQVAQSIGSTAQVAAKLQSTVAQFKVTE
ncbi:Methyl-accepting chemotaxis protein [Hyella patelloides LEGE 07179]|uniref:Methyl-accepting chemotaxis protein n=1 Tax=Hyella patelloides LEGE 07179 TaxID=945734 RepID=A0A563VMV4_9CYAN|nr:methyl-accepting chemotaxis protein [Hyella patelloides]VEP12742.1 Methyl-accepting chemotaxis protein [Hyella patelloides LEGE 07179]